VVCEYLFATVDSQLTNEDGSPTPVFRVAVAACMLLGAAFVFGTFFLPGVAQALDANDPLLAAAVVGLVVVCAALVPLILVEERRNFCGDEQGLLRRLDVGKQLVPAKADTTLRKVFAMLDPTCFKPKSLVMHLVPYGIACGYIIVTGIGVQPIEQGCTTGPINFGFNHYIINDPGHMGPPRQALAVADPFSDKLWSNASFQFAPLMVIPYKISGDISKAATMTSLADMARDLYGLPLCPYPIRHQNLSRMPISHIRHHSVLLDSSKQRSKSRFLGRFSQTCCTRGCLE